MWNRCSSGRWFDFPRESFYTFFVKRIWLAIAFIPLAAGFLSCSKKAPTASPNIVLLTVDAMRADHLGCYGYRYNTSPNIDRFAALPTVSQFNYAYCTIPKTSASFASMLTGLHPFVHKTKGNRDFLKTRYITLPEALRLKGYRTSAIVDNGNLSKKYHFNQGFQDYTEVWLDVDGLKDSSSFITQRVSEYLKKKQDQPFFLWAHYIETHAPYNPPQQYIEARPKGRDIHQIAKKMVVGTKHEREILRSRSDEGYFISLYDGSVKYVDELIGRVLDDLKSGGFFDNTIIIISSDHGEDLGERNFFFDHGPLAFQEAARIPLLVHIPNQKGSRISYPVSLMDLYPTLLKAVDLVPPYPIQGRNLFDFDKDRFLLIKAMAPDLGSYGVVYQKAHYVRISPDTAKSLNLQETYLFDIYRDPEEKDSILSSRRILAVQMEEAYRTFFNRFSRGQKKPSEKADLSKKDLDNLKSLGYIK